MNVAFNRDGILHNILLSVEKDVVVYSGSRTISIYC